MFLNVLIYSLIAGISTIAGTLLIFYNYKWAKHNSIHLMSFAAGIMLALAFLHLIPEAIEMSVPINGSEYVQADFSNNTGKEHQSINKFVFLTILAAFVFFSALESIIRIHPRHDIQDDELHEHHDDHHGTLSVLSIAGLTLHSAIDGVIIAVGFKADFQIGIMTTVAVILHEVPEGIITTSIPLHDMMEKAQVLWFSALVAGATPAGAIGFYFLLGGMTQGILYILLSLAAGSLIYIAASDLIPETHRDEKSLNALFLIAGILILYLLGSLLGH